MGLHDRDYMKGGSGDYGTPASSTDEKVEAYLAGFLQKHRRTLLIIGVVLALLLVAGLLMALP
jgi:hypothetical protein